MNTRFMVRKFVKMATSIIVLVCYLVSCTLAEALTTGWYRVGPYGARINCFAVVGSTLYFGGGSYDGGDAVYQSTDNGVTWSKVGSNLMARQRYVKGLIATGTGRLVAFTVDPTYHNQRQAYLLRNDAKLGWVWDKVDTGLVSDGSYPWGGAITDNNGDVLLGGYGTVQRLAYDAGTATWSWINDVKGLDNEKVLFITKDSSDNMYVVTESEKVFKRVGSAWEYIGTFTAEAINAYNFVSSGTSLYVSAGANLYRSNDGGSNWAQMGTASPGHPLVVGSNYIYNTNQRSSDSGSSWQAIPGVVGQVQSSIKFNGIDFLGTSQGLYRSTNGGATWDWQNLANVACYQAYKLRLLANNNFFVASENGVYRSSDKGINWKPITSQLAYDVIVVNATGELLVNEFLADRQKHRLVRYTSGDGGLTWQLSSILIPEQSAPLVIFRDVNADLYVADQPLGNNGQARIRKSSNNGLDWISINSGLPTRAITGFAKKGTDLIIGTHGSGLYWFNTTTSTWSPLGTGIPGSLHFVKDVMVAPSGTVYAALFGNESAGIYKLVGSAWTRIGQVHAPTAVHAVNDATIYYGLDNGRVYKTANGGANWSLDTTFSGNPKVNDLELSPDNFLYAATNLGVFDPPIVFDHCAPVVIPSLSSGSYNTEQELSFSLNEVGTVYANVYGTSPTLADMVTEPMQLSEGRHTICYKAIDLAGNATLLHRLEIVIDKTAPTLNSNLDSGTYVGAQILELISEEPSATLRLLIDGVMEFQTLPYHLVVDRDMTVQASVYDSVYNESELLTWEFNIESEAHGGCTNEVGCQCQHCKPEKPATGGSGGGGSSPGGEEKIKSVCLVKVASQAKQTTFTDTEQHWAKEAIHQLAESGIVEGYSLGQNNAIFAPDAGITRGEFVAMLMRMVDTGQSESIQLKFVDQLPAWAEVHIQKAVSLNLVGGYPDGSFRPEAQISRAEMALVLSRLTELLELEGRGDIANIAEELPVWAEGHVSKVVELGLVQGYHDGTFRPEQGLTRAEMATVLYRLLTLAN